MGQTATGGVPHRGLLHEYKRGQEPGLVPGLDPDISLRDIPKRLMMLLSGTDNRRNHSDEVEALQSRARELYATASSRSNG